MDSRPVTVVSNAALWALDTALNAAGSSPRAPAVLRAAGAVPSPGRFPTMKRVWPASANRPIPVPTLPTTVDTRVSGAALPNRFR